MLKQIRFDWDQWNSQKNEIKHGVSAEEAESVFADRYHALFRDVIHSTASEHRYIILGESSQMRVLMVGFTVRRDKFRIITARPASRRERKLYEEEKI